MVVQHNLTAMNANRYFGMNNSKLAGSLEKLSSGYAINRAGDNAAGLAVSEKMRAQIGGITQAVKNAQDGISMVQTFEGALTETDNILQRMRSLAVQSANGTYDNSVDRAAIQLEYDQLNDELDQIADTDFNGVVVLNGGKMADGLEQIDGEFNYANKEDQVILEANEAYAKAEKAARDEVTAAQKVFDGEVYDLSASGGAKEWNTVDNNFYDKTKADALWVDAGLEDAAGDADTSKVQEITVTFTNDGSGAWTVTGAKGNDGSDLMADITTTTTANDVTDASGIGGFKYAGAEVLIDETNVKKGDTVTLKFTNSDATQIAPEGISFKSDSVGFYKADGVTESTQKDTKITALTEGSIVLGGVTDANLTEEIANIYKALDGVEFTATYDGDAAFAADHVTLGGQKLAVGTDYADININGQNMKYNLTAAGVLTITDTQDGGVATDAGATLMTLTLGADAATAGAEDVGVLKGKIAIENAAYAPQSGIDVVAGKHETNNTSTKNGDALAAAKEAYTKITDAKPDGTYEKALAFLGQDGVSVSDSNQASSAILTYKDNISLQVGARTKDSVNFTFAYASDGLGDLDADLNCTAKGLGTDELTLATQEGANAAIDKIDNAINKVSMVRGTFGSIQNRLEHKIDNLNVTNENLTAAESRIRDTDMAAEMMNFTKQQILSQASQSMLAQANQLPQGVLSLLG